MIRATDVSIRAQGMWITSRGRKIIAVVELDTNPASRRTSPLFTNRSGRLSPPLIPHYRLPHARASYHVAVDRVKHIRWLPVSSPRYKPLIVAPVHPLISGHHRAIPDSPATAPGAYKLSTPSAPLGNYAISEATRTSNHSLELANFSFPQFGFPPSWKQPRRAQRNSGQFTLSDLSFECFHTPVMLVNASNWARPPPIIGNTVFFGLSTLSSWPETNR
jgi:hypothetical protein